MTTNNQPCLLFYSDLPFCDRGHHLDHADISEDEAAYRYRVTEGGKQVRMDTTFQTLYSYTQYNTRICLMFLVSRAISYIMSTLFYPIITFFLLAICIAYGAVTAVYPYKPASSKYRNVNKVILLYEHQGDAGLDC